MKLQRVHRFNKVVKDAYWAVVQDCLTGFFGVSRADAATLSRDRRSLVDFAPSSVHSAVFYEREPFDVASDLAERRPGQITTKASLDDPSTLARYEQLLTQHGLH